MAARFWPNDNPLGKRLRQGADGPWRMVVGVVRDTREYEVDAELLRRNLQDLLAKLIENGLLEAGGG